MMAKIPFSKLGTKVDNEVVLLHWGEYEIEIKKYLPMSDKADMVSKIVNLSLDSNGYYNPLKVKVYLTLETVYYYTNLSFTDKQKENVFKLYDIMLSTGLFEQIIKCIPEKEWQDLQDSVQHTISNVYEYRNSMVGVLEAFKHDYDSLDLDATLLQGKLADPTNLTLIRDILDKMG